VFSFNSAWRGRSRDVRLPRCESSNARHLRKDSASRGAPLSQYYFISNVEGNHMEQVDFWQSANR
jgi:hypothetical protein